MNSDEQINQSEAIGMLVVSLIVTAVFLLELL